MTDRPPSVRHLAAAKIADAIIEHGLYGAGGGDVELTKETQDNPRRVYLTRFENGRAKGQVEVYGEDFLLVTTEAGFKAIYETPERAREAVLALCGAGGRGESDLELLPTRALEQES